MKNQTNQPNPKKPEIGAFSPLTLNMNYLIPTHCIDSMENLCFISHKHGTLKDAL